ncbi:MAG: hypothetical protein ACM3ML_33920 [Micromonosporaceae bacterium]
MLVAVQAQCEGAEMAVNAAAAASTHCAAIDAGLRLYEKVLAASHMSSVTRAGEPEAATWSTTIG